MRRDFQTSKAEEELGNLFLVARKKGITFTKREASRWVGGRYVLERLVAERKIRMAKPGTGRTRNGNAMRRMCYATHSNIKNTL